ncbi:MAG: PAS domain S-box protein [Bacteroidetes bacterium]|nr:PAS domain S-box protein [Bacteroidota bacterium]
MEPVSLINTSEILEHFSEGFLLIDPGGKIIFWNKALEEITGMKREEALNRPQFEVMYELVVPEKKTPEILNRIKKSLAEAFKRGGHPLVDAVSEAKIFTKNGERKTILQTAFMFKSSDGFYLGSVIRDITERKKIEEELSQKENRYHLIFESAHDSIFLMDKEVFIDCNPKTLETFGCKREDIIGQSPFAWSPELQPDGRLSTEKGLEKINLALSGKPQTFDWLHKRLDGHLFDAEVSLNTVNLEGKIYLQAMVRNVSKKNKANNQLRKFSQCLLHFTADSQQNIQSMTSVFAEIIGADAALYNRLEGEFLHTLGKSGVPADYIQLDKADGHLCFDVIQKQSREIFLVHDLPSSQYFATDPNVKKYGLKTYMGHPVRFGENTIGSLCAVFTYDFNPDEADKLIISMVASAIGMEEVRLSEYLKLQESEKKYQDLTRVFRLMADNMPDKLWAKDLEKRYLFANKSHAEISLQAKDVEDPIGKTDLFFAEKQRLLHPGDPKYYTFGELCRDTDEIIMETRKAEKFEESGYLNGKYTIFDVYKAPILDEKGEMIGTVGTAREVTKEKEVEQKIRKYTEDLQELNNSKDKFFSIISHDLKGPFNAILGFSEILTREWADFTDEERQHFVRNINSSAQNTFKLLENLLAWSIAQTGRQNFNPFPVDMSVVTNDMVILLRDQAEKKQIKIFTAVNFGTVVLADEQMVRTVIRNLISNAIKFTPLGGQVKIYTETVKDENGHKDMIKICITDTGIGISAENMDKLFRIDQQLRSTGTANEKGTGLGLILCKELVDKHGGNIWVESELGKGSKFCVTLPKV